MRLRQQALQIWHAGVDSVRADHLLAEGVTFDDGQLIIEEEAFQLPPGGQIEVVGAGKASASMAAGLVDAYSRLQPPHVPLTGWINIPDGTQRAVTGIHQHVGRPAGVNEPTAAAIAGTQAILERIARLTAEDTCIALISGGGSALLTAPIEGITLEDKLQTIRCLSGGGANIEELNTVRKHLSRVKGGGLANACRAGQLLTLVISDVLGDPLDLIASGPTIHDPSTAEDALQILRQYDTERALPTSIYAALEHPRPTQADGFPPVTRTFVLGNNATAVDEAGVVAEQLGMQHAMQCARRSEGPAEEIGRHLADMAVNMLRNDGPNCLITGGEPTVHLAPAARRGRGGRNQQLVLAAMQRLRDRGDVSDEERRRMVILSGGTDGEDGPTDAAGAVLDGETWQRFAEQSLELDDALARNDAYTFFQKLDALLITGPTHTNVCDLRVVVVDRQT